MRLHSESLPLHVEDLVRVLRHLIQEELEERSQTEEDRDGPIRRERDLVTTSCYSSIQSI